MQMDHEKESHLNILALYFKTQTKQNKVKRNPTRITHLIHLPIVLPLWTETMEMGPITGLQQAGRPQTPGAPWGSSKP